ncbi:MAG: UDP-N-acetylmuramoyl-tripeptide--D-alanyl-D-alanine ligase, partial [Deltaproteobacteria bacterium]|nr:UDP-N-acetylmuramoyl-tripeptide--D-alanyl-D-alanine ligase [Deltaproteobacteria bacterium]
MKEIAGACRGELISGHADPVIAGISTDTRTLNKGEIFLALKGENFDGHDFVQKALGKEAAGLILARESAHGIDIKNAQVPVLLVDDTLKALGDIASFYRRKFTIPAAGITGSNGKTTTKEMASHLLSARFKVRKNKGTENNLIGVPLTLLKLNPEDEAMVLELGTNHFGEIRRLSEILGPQIGVITNVGPSHLEYFGDLDGVLKAKLELLDGMEKGGTLILNLDDKRLAALSPAKFKKVTFGFDPGYAFFAKGIKLSGESTEFLLQGKIPVRLNLPGRHNIENALAAFAVGASLGLSEIEMAGSISGFTGISQRLKKYSAGGIDILDDTYNANPASVSAALGVLSSYTSAGRKILILGDMLELGQ